MDLTKNKKLKKMAHGKGNGEVGPFFRVFSRFPCNLLSPREFFYGPNSLAPACVKHTATGPPIIQSGKFYP